jgi:hypothetical protein
LILADHWGALIEKEMRKHEKRVNGRGVRRRNGIRGSTTLRGWIKQYGREDILPKRVKAGTMNEIDEAEAGDGLAGAGFFALPVGGSFFGRLDFDFFKMGHGRFWVTFSMRQRAPFHIFK